MPRADLQTQIESNDYQPTERCIRMSDSTSIWLQTYHRRTPRWCMARHASTCKTPVGRLRPCASPYPGSFDCFARLLDIQHIQYVVSSSSLRILTDDELTSCPAFGPVHDMTTMPLLPAASSELRVRPFPDHGQDDKQGRQLSRLHCGKTGYRHLFSQPHKERYEVGARPPPGLPDDTVSYSYLTCLSA